MAVSALNHKTPASYTIRLGDTILQPTKALRYSTVQYNHKPVLRRAEDVKATIRTTRDDGEALVLSDGAEKYEYTGERHQTDDSYILIFNGDKEVVLEKVGSGHVFNLTKTPNENDQAKLAAQYPQISSRDDDELSADEEPADANNPFDYRHFLKPTTTEPTQPYKFVPRSGAGTPSTQPVRAASSTPVARPIKRTKETTVFSQKKRKAQPTSSTTEPPNAKRAKPMQQAPPKIRIDRKASLRRPSVAAEDDGELILENETPTTERPPIGAGEGRSAMALALSGQLGVGQGPISLRSAASSPASRAASPAPIRPAVAEEDGEEIEIGGSDDGGDGGARPRSPDLDDLEDRDDGHDDDADVEDLELPSPATVARPADRRASIDVKEADAGGGEDDDLDAQLAAAMAEEEEEESEEE